MRHPRMWTLTYLNHEFISTSQPPSHFLEQPRPTLLCIGKTPRACLQNLSNSSFVSFAAGDLLDLSHSLTIQIPIPRLVRVLPNPTAEQP